MVILQPLEMSMTHEQETRDFQMLGGPTSRMAVGPRHTRITLECLKIGNMTKEELDTLMGAPHGEMEVVIRRKVEPPPPVTINVVAADKPTPAVQTGDRPETEEAITW